MRRIVLFDHLSVDGCFASRDGNLDWVTHEPAIDRDAASRTGGVDTILFGRRTYEAFAGFWPRYLADTSVGNPHASSGRTPELDAMARVLDEATKLVFSRSLGEASWRNSRIVRELDPRAIAALKQGPGKGIMLFGSGSLVAPLAAHRLIDEYQLVVGPLLLGSGRPLVAALDQRLPLKLLGADAFPSGNVMLRYAPA